MGWRIETRIVRGSKGSDPYTGAISFPIYQTATFRHPGLGETTGYDYSRSENPTREEVEKTMASLENGKAGFAFASGMAAIANILELFSFGDHLLVSDDLYGGTYRLFEEISRRHGLQFTYINTCIKENVIEAIQGNTRAIFIETPSNPMMKVTDIRFIVHVAQSRNILTIVDNTFLTPYFQRPLELGADIVVHSGTKYLSGHNDTLSGFVIVKDERLEERLRLIQRSIGATLAPIDSWLVLRGLKTLAIRLERQQQNALVIAKWLKEHRQVEKVHYVGLPDHEGYDISKQQASGFGAMISFSVKDAALAEGVFSRVKLIAFAESLGGVESLITYPITQTHASIPKEIREKLGVNERLLRLSVGIEAVEDIITDLEQALDKPAT
ncbi:MAG TPA: PLP-dependent aspartate aminotransferase family protein [Syntrophomonadaceae bacterium]|nr:PLP-dependent aspartate aminotransferase family protein [Syntrophomonadaceae bacterium]